MITGFGEEKALWWTTEVPHLASSKREAKGEEDSVDLAWEGGEEEEALGAAAVKKKGTEKCKE